MLSSSHSLLPCGLYMCNHLSGNKIVYLMQSLWWLQVKGSSLLSWILSAHNLSHLYKRLWIITTDDFLLFHEVIK